MIRAAFFFVRTCVDGEKQVCDQTPGCDDDCADGCCDYTSHYGTVRQGFDHECAIEIERVIALGRLANPGEDEPPYTDFVENQLTEDILERLGRIASNNGKNPSHAYGVLSDEVLENVLCVDVIREGSAKRDGHPCYVIEARQVLSQEVRRCRLLASTMGLSFRLGLYRYANEDKFFGLIFG